MLSIESIDPLAEGGYRAKVPSRERFEIIDRNQEINTLISERGVLELLQETMEDSSSGPRLSGELSLLLKDTITDTPSGGTAISGRVFNRLLAQGFIEDLPQVRELHPPKPLKRRPKDKVSMEELPSGGTRIEVRAHFDLPHEQTPVGHIPIRFRYYTSTTIFNVDRQKLEQRLEETDHSLEGLGTS